MTSSAPRIPAVPCFSGLDPTGGAGLQADIETVAAMGGHPLPIATSLTAQDTHDVRALMPVEPRHVIAQARTLLADVPVAAVKVGLLGSVAMVDALQEVLAECGGAPVVLDPIDRAGGGAPLAGDELMGAVFSRLVPRVTVLTPNTREAYRLAPGAATLADAAARLTASGCGYVLVTGADEGTPLVVNRLYGREGLVEAFEWPRVEGVFHGSGCTLAAAVAAGLAHGRTVRAAVTEAQRFTHDAISHGYRIGAGQLVPDRLRGARRRRQGMAAARRAGER